VDFLISPMVNVLLFFYSILGLSFPLAIVVVTIIVRAITLPLTLPQQRQTKKMQELAPQLEELKKKYGNDRAKMSQAQMQLYKENNVNMFGGCLPLILNLFIMIAFYQAIIGALAVNPLQLLQLSHRALPDLASYIPINSRFLWLNLGQPDQFFVLPILVVVTTYLSQKLMTPPSVDSSASAMTRQMNIMMPLMFGLFALQFASGLSIYFIVSNLVGIVQAWLVNRSGNPALAPVTASPSKASKPIASKPIKEQLPATSATKASKK
jgi:YidC/Oxa1 family membrane protein insertase